MYFYIVLLLLVEVGVLQSADVKKITKQPHDTQIGKRSVFGELGLPSHVDNQLEFQHDQPIPDFGDDSVTVDAGLQLDQAGSIPAFSDDSVVVESAANTRTAALSTGGGLLVQASGLNTRQGGALLIQLPPTLNTINYASGVGRTTVNIQRSIELEPRSLPVESVPSLGESHTGAISLPLDYISPNLEQARIW